MQISVQKQDILTRGWKGHFSNLSVWSLIVSNLLVIVWALVEHGSVFVIMWIYWSQSISIGIVWFIMMISLKEFTTKDLKINSRPVTPTRGTKIRVSMFFLFHYGLFHVVYAVFLAEGSKFIEPIPIVIGGAIFLVNQLFSFFYNSKKQNLQKPNLGKLMFFPYARIVPMHITVIGTAILRDKGFNVDSGITLVLFLLLKTLADVVMYIRQLEGFADKSVRKFGSSERRKSTTG